MGKLCVQTRQRDNERNDDNGHAMIMFAFNMPIVDAYGRVYVQYSTQAPPQYI